MENFLKGVGLTALFLLLTAVIGLLVAWPVEWLWNWLMPLLFGFRTITFWQALGLYALCGVLFKNSNSSSSK